jgi:hypothetical protein
MNCLDYERAVDKWTDRWTSADYLSTTVFTSYAGSIVEKKTLQSLRLLMTALHDYQLQTPEECVLYSTRVEEHALQATRLMIAELYRIQHGLLEQKAGKVW